MTRQVLKRFAIGVAVLSGVIVVAVLAVVAYGYSSNEQGLKKGVDYLLSHELGVRYHIQHESLEPDGLDPSGDWWIVLESDPWDLRAKLEKAGFAQNDELDRPYWVHSARTKFGFYTVPENAQSFAAELTLGKDSCCFTQGFGCNVLVVFKAGDPNVFVRIWKI